MKAYKIFKIIFVTIFCLWIAGFITPLLNVYLTNIAVNNPYEKNGRNRPIAKKFIDKTYVLKQDLILAKFDTEPFPYLLDRFSIENDLVVPIETDRKYADYWIKVEKDTKLTIKKIGIESLYFYGELPAPRIYALISGYEDKGLVDVSALLPFDSAYFYKIEEKHERQIAIMESVNPDACLIRSID